MKYFSKKFFVFLLFFSQIDCGEKHVIGSWDAGLFSNYFGVLNQIYWCERVGKIPAVYWGQESPYWQEDGYNGVFNAWEYFFEPISFLQVDSNEPRDIRYSIDRVVFHFNQMSLEKRLLANKLINKYIRVIPAIKRKVETFFEQNMAKRKTIGIHLRGTDKYTEVRVVDPLVIIECANKEAELLGDCQIFVATDEYRLLHLAQEKLHKPVIFYLCERATTAQPLWYSGHVNSRNDLHKAYLGEDVLVEALLLARCDLFLHTYSNVSTAVLYFNPSLRNILFT